MTPMRLMRTGSELSKFDSGARVLPALTVHVAGHMTRPSAAILFTSSEVSYIPEEVTLRVATYAS
jgi:hypothetical protein